ncbi:MAG TPA: AmmeMemoRadiSam system protein A [Candidatus Nanoarchaeia archaeon]|nr:AmmeMemoRadiSam system protein A [Candidatus Nanoarchaeia archaeon]
MENSDKKFLLALARESIKSYFDDEKPDMSKVKHLREKRGVFVTLHDKYGELRGCIGFPMPTYPLNMAIVEAARSAAFHDPRFPPLKKEEMEEVEIEISVLTVPEEIKVKHPNEYLKAINIGEDGLVIHGDFCSGLLLPQVATENNFNVPTFLNCLCQKAGMGFSCWKDLKNKISKFQAEVFNEKEFE